MKKAYADVTEGQLHYLTEGKGETILLLHMAGGSSNEYKGVIPFLSPFYRVIALDLPGFGESYKPPYEYQVADYADCVMRFLDALGIQKASILGHRASAVITLEMAAQWPERISKLVLLNLPYNPDFNKHKARRNLPSFNKVEIDAEGKHLLEWWKRAARHGSPKELSEERALDIHRAGPRGEELHWALFAYDPTPRLPLVKCPTLLISGIPKELPSPVDYMKKLIPNSQITIIENSPILISQSMPKELAEAILAFLKQY
jgi:pimeloyl-ACP methyl ester carboxylesterase